MADRRNLYKNCIKCYLLLLHISAALCRSSTRIVGGVPATIDKAPYLVQIVSNGDIMCGGTLISDQWVVTAAHCFDNNPKRLKIVAGTTRLTEIGHEARIQHIAIPGNYKKDSSDSDFALIKLRKPLKGNNIDSIPLCQDDIKAGDEVKIYGWGLLNEKSDNIPIQARMAKVNVVNKTLCTEMYKNKENLTENMFCAQGDSMDACSGDSGGPAIVNDRLCGVISWGEGCARTEYPGVYTDVNKFLKFIKKIMSM